MTFNNLTILSIYLLSTSIVFAVTNNQNKFANESTSFSVGFAHTINQNKIGLANCNNAIASGKSNKKSFGINGATHQHLYAKRSGFGQTLKIGLGAVLGFIAGAATALVTVFFLVGKALGNNWQI